VTHLNHLVVDNVKYTGDEIIIEQLQRAMRENFMSQIQHSAAEIGEGVRQNPLPRDVTEALIGIQTKKKIEPNKPITTEYDI
jgi:hypothetical protein